MKVNKTHSDTLIENPVKEPFFAELVKLVSPYAGISGVNTDKKSHCFAIPPFRRFSPPANNLVNLVESFSPYEGSYRRVFILMDCDWLTNKF